MSFPSGSGPNRSGWWGVVEKRKKTWKKPVFLGRWGVKNRQKSTKWVRGPPYPPCFLAIFGIFGKNWKNEKSRKLNRGIVHEIDTFVTKNAKNPKNGPKCQKSTFLKKVPFWHFLTLWSKMGSILDPLKIRGLKNVLREQRENGQNLSKKVSKMTPKMTPKTPFRPLFYTLFSKSPLEKGWKWQKGGKKVQKKWKKG